MPIYTKTGDEGTTSLLGGRRVSKSIVRFEAIGCLDELNSILGIIISQIGTKEKLSSLKEYLPRIQSELLSVGSDLATPYSASSTFQKSIERIPEDFTKRLESEIDQMTKKLPKLRYFILPGGQNQASQLQLARAVARRAERNVVRLTKGAKVNPEILKYLNRLSDWLFVAARWVNVMTRTEEKIWN